MRDVAFSLLFAALSFMSLLNPFAGLLSWTWIAFALPSSHLWGFAATLPVNLIIALATIVGWLLAPGEKAFRPERMMVLLLILAAIVTLSAAFSLSPEISQPKLKVYAINFAFLFVMIFCLTTKVRFDAFIWMTVLCIGFYAIKGGVAFIINGGAYQFEGPEGTSISDNNHLAVAFLLALPLMNYLRLHANHSFIKALLGAAIVLTILAVLCTQSRGGFIGLVALGVAFWWMSGRRIAHLAAGLLIAGIAVSFASNALVSRLQTIETAHQHDRSFLGRVASWELHTLAALDRPLTGAGPYALQAPSVFAKYRPTSSIVGHQLDKPVAAHSIYFQVLGEHGFVALGLYLSLIWTAWRNASFAMRQCADKPSQLWIFHLASMIRLGIVSFAVAGAAVSMAFYDFFLAILMLTACLRRTLQHAPSSVDRQHDQVTLRPATSKLGQYRHSPNLGKYRRSAR